MHVLLLALILVFLHAPAFATDIRGKVAHVRDGDTIEIATNRGRIAIRLNGVDAPELDERGGQAGKRWMTRNYAGSVLDCKLNGDKTYDRWVGVCYDKDGTDIGSAIIAAGLARDCPRYSKGRYRKYETKASRSIPQKPYCR